MTVARALAGMLVLLALIGTACGAGTKVEPEADPDPISEAGPGEVSTPPPDASIVNVDLTEWSVTPDVSSVPVGEVYFLANNIGGEPHEMLLVRSDLPPGDLPTDNGRVPEDGIDIVGEIKPFGAGSQASTVFDLEPGSYVLLCNIVEIANGNVESHYENGMYAAFTVQ